MPTPRFNPTPEQRQTVKMLTGFGIPQEDICLLIINPANGTPITVKTLHKYFRHEINTGAVTANAAVIGALYKNATNENNVAAQIWWTKSRCRWTEKGQPSEDEVPSPVKVVVEAQDARKQPE